MADSTKILLLIDRTLDQTRKGKLDWSVTPEDDVFSVVISSGQYILKTFKYSNYGEDGAEGPPSLSLFSKENELLLDVVSSNPGELKLKLRELYELSRDKALGVTEALDHVLESLIDMDIPF